jgi:hypothetical protein
VLNAEQINSVKKGQSMLTNIYISLRKFFDTNKTGATNIYLGRESWKRVQELDNKNIVRDGDRPTFLGLKVYIVDADNHVALS